MGQPHHRLTHRNDLSGFGERLDNGAICIGKQQGVAAFVAGNLRLSLGRSELRIGGIERRLRLLVFLLG
jgi:hypothetical protein